jgi:hypothetical protein
MTFRPGVRIERRLLLATALLCSGRAGAADLFVDGATGDDARDGLTWATALATVTEALGRAAATPGSDVVSVAEGRYVERLVVPADVTLLGGYPRGGGGRDILAHPTVLDGARAGPVVVLGVGTDACLVEGFTITNGRSVEEQQAGGVNVVASGATVRWCVIERNSGCAGGGVLIDGQGLPVTPQVDRCVIRGNRVDACTWPCRNGGGAWVRGLDGPSTGIRPVLVDSLVAGNVAVFSLPACVPWARAPKGAGGVYITPAVWVEGLRVRGNTEAGLVVSSGLVDPASARLVRNCEFSRNADCGARHDCYAKPEMLFDGCTFADNGFCGFTGVNSTVLEELEMRPRVRRSVLANGLYAVVHGGVCYFNSTDELEDSLIQGGLPWGLSGGVDLIDADPLFVAGPAGDYYLSQAAAGQAQDSPALDAGNVTATGAGMDALTTRTDHAFDAGAVDLGVHHAASDLWGRAWGPVTVLRGTTPTGLTLRATVADLPFTDEPGILSDAALPLLFYAVEWPANDIWVEKDFDTDSLRIRY